MNNIDWNKLVKDATLGDLRDVLVWAKSQSDLPQHEISEIEISIRGTFIKSDKIFFAKDLVGVFGGKYTIGKISRALSASGFESYNRRIYNKVYKVYNMEVLKASIT